MEDSKARNFIFKIIHMLNIHSDLVQKEMAAIGTNAFCVLLAISSHISPLKRDCFPSRAKIKKITGLGDDAIRSAIKKLSDVGYLRMEQSRIDEPGKTKGRFEKTIYTVMTPHIGVYCPVNQVPVEDEKPGGPERHPADPHAGERHPADPALSISNEGSISNEKSLLPQPPSGELQSLSSAPATTQTPRRPPVTWESVLKLRATPALDGTVSPAEDGDIWERRMFVFDAVRRKYPGTKAGLLQEFNGFLKKCWKDKLVLDTELSRMLYAVLYQIKWKEAKNQAEEFSAAWKNFSTWINQAYWQSDMDSWKSKSEWFHGMCSPETKQEVERLKSILVCK